MPPAGRADTPRAMIERIECLTRESMAMPFSDDILGEEQPLVLHDVVSCPPPFALVEWVQAHVSPDAVFAIDRWNQFLPSVFMPQQVVAFPGFERAFADEETLFKGYYAFYDAALRRYRAQPFFNREETDLERATFLRTLGVTHVLVDPAYYDEMRPILDRLPQLLVLKYAAERWAVYEVRSPA
jgi:hypothetical protein